MSENIMNGAISAHVIAGPSEWETTTLGGICQINPVKPKADSLPADALVSFVPMAAVDEVSGSIVAPEERQFANVRGSYTAFQEGDVLFAKITPCMENGKAAIARGLSNNIGFGSSEFHVLRPCDKVLPEFIYQLIRQKQFRAEAKANMTGSVGQARVPTEWLKNFELELPPIETQREIVDLLSRFQVKMESTSGRLATIPALLKKFRQSVLAAACSGQLTADWRGTDSHPLWKSVTLAEVSTSVLGKMLDKGKNKGVPKPYLRNSNVRWGGFDLSDLKTMPFEDKESERYGLKRGDVLICEGGEPGRCAVWENDDSDIRFQKAIHRVRCYASLNPYFLARTIRNLVWSGELVNYFTGSGIAHLTGKSLAKVEFDLPPIDEQVEIVRRVESLFALADCIESRISDVNAQVERTTRAILARAFRGEL